MIKKEFSILEFDTDREVFINPNIVHKKIEIAENAVLCFLGDAIDKFKKIITF